MHIKPAIVVAFSLTAGLVLFWAVRRPPSDILKKTVLVEPATLEAKSEGGDASPLSFVIRNLGKTSIEIADVTATCGCTVVKVPRRNLASNGSMKIEVHATIPSVGERKSIIGIHTIPPQQVPLKVIVTLKGKEQPAPFISYCPDAITMSGSVLGEEVVKEFEVHTIEKKGPTPWLAKEQLAEPNLRIITEAPPAEETLDSKTLRRVYKMKVSAVISDVSQSATSRYRHVIATSSKSSSPEKAITIESTFAPLVRATPAVLNWTVVSGISSSVERTVIVIDERTDQSSSPFRFRAGHDWLKVTTDKVTQQDGRSIHSFRVNFDAPRFSATLGESVTHSMLSFFLDNDETALVTVPVFVKIQ